MEKQLNLPASSQPNVQIINNQAVTSSLDVADYFSKQHKNVLQRIQNLNKLNPEFGRLNFKPSNYTNSQGKEQPCFLMTRAGFSVAVLGFTGEKALHFQIAYVNRFEVMEAELSGKQLQLDAPSTKTDREPLTNLVNTLVKHAPVDYPDVWHMIKAELKTDKAANDFTVGEVYKALAFVQTRVDLHTANEIMPDRPDIITEQAMKGVKAFIARISIEEPTQDAKVKLVNKQFRATVYISEEKPPSECTMNIEYMLSRHHKN